MVKAGPSDRSWQHLYRALLRSSAASVRFSRPAARNTRRYLRDDFANAVVVGVERFAGPSLDRPDDAHDDARPLVAGQCSGQERPPSVRNPIEPSIARSRHQPRKQPSLRQVTHRQTHNTLAFHLSASLLPTSEDRTPGAVDSSANFASEDVANDRIRGRLGPALSHSHQTEHVELRPLSGDLTVHGSRKAAKKQDQPTRAARLAHRVVSNLASLTYHHLSPYTQMQSRTHLKHNRARKPQKLSSLARVLGKVEADLSLDASQTSGETELSDVFSGNSQSHGGGLSHGAGETMLNALHMKLGFLMPSVKPVRGPVSSRLKEWDGQNADRIASEGGLRQMESDLKTIERLLADHDHVQRDKGARVPQSALLKQVQQLKLEAEELRRKIKAATRALAQVEAQKQMESIPIEHLSDLVAAAQDSQQVLLGKTRWLRRKNGEFLHP